jgi:ubiquinone/menaquinone biosynthesis C-methylase UbiE
LPGIGYLYKKRIAMMLQALQGIAVNHILDIGYGSGVLCPFIHDLCQTYTGIDIHGHAQDVERALKTQGFHRSTFLECDLFRMSFAGASFDVALAMSVLEHLTNLEEAMRCVARVIRRGGFFVVGVPSDMLPMRLYFKIANLDPFWNEHPSSPEDIQAAAKNHFELVQILRYPARWFSMYDVLKLRKR